MSESYELGKEGEIIAAQHLEKKGYVILERRWRFGNAEIDLIARRRDILYIVEVKTRSDDKVAKPEESITFKKRNLLIEAANAYVIEADIEVEVQFDVITLINRNNQWKINHIPDAFRPHF